MGRARGKLTIKNIQNEKARKLAFNQRSKGLAKKVSEFSSKFGVDACLIVYDGDGSRPSTWPQNSTIVRSILEKYELQKIETTPKEFDLKDYFANKKNMVEAEISKVRKEIVMNKYPTWGACFNNMKGEQLKTFIGLVDSKIQACNRKISMLKEMQQINETGFMLNNAQMQHIHDDPLKSLNNTNGTMDLRNDVSFPRVSVTNQLVEYGLTDWANQLSEIEMLDDPVAKPGEEWVTQLMDFDVFAWEDISFMCQNEQGAALDALLKP